MTKYTGYVSLDTSSYNAWKNEVLSNEYDCDNNHSSSSWDLASEFWYNVGFPQGYPVMNNRLDYTIWDNRVENAGDKFDIITDKTEIKQGDIIVFNTWLGSETGHIGFATMDYTGNTNINILSQANGAIYTNIDYYSLTYFLGAFRYKAWHETPPTPPEPPVPEPTKKPRFKWALYADKLRRKRNGL